MVNEVELKVQKAIEESELAKKLLNTPMRQVYESIIAMIGKPQWDQKFVARLLNGFAQCLKALDADYETIVLLTFYYSRDYQNIMRRRVSALTVLQCPECEYLTGSGKEFVKHLSKHHPKKAAKIFLRFMAQGKIKIEVS